VALALMGNGSDPMVPGHIEATPGRVFSRWAVRRSGAEQVEALVGMDEVVSPAPVLGEAEEALADLADDAAGGVEESVAQRLGFDVARLPSRQRIRSQAKGSDPASTISNHAWLAENVLKGMRSRPVSRSALTQFSTRAWSRWRSSSSRGPPARVGQDDRWR
jgi:hypothetical protein